MVCASCLRKSTATSLATPAVKRKNDPVKPSPTAGQTGIGKSKLASKSAKNPYAAYASSCSTCKTKTEAGRKYCHRCAYKANACAICGKSQNREKNKAGGAPVVEGMKFSSK